MEEVFVKGFKSFYETERRRRFKPSSPF